ncbi:TatD family hydrolase [bacterium]|jgi:TatD DNase family protein|nr:TatD family hydrolase [bacterium]MBT4927942.1 TatD family hydrolase [bacterium]MBT5733296.1 TatD family hydrolase [bacterium]MBT6018867.1 TatD family hydrolase [bacterium]MBT6776774.1 TatD family hydrolase [bacterium]
MLIDTHCHLFFDELKEDLSNVLKRAADLGVTKFICVGTNIEDSKESHNLALNYEKIFSTAGVHPHDAEEVAENYIDELYNLLKDKKVLAVGEIGLDYFKELSDIRVQKKIFAEQLELAQKINKPIVFHNRDSDDDIINILSEFPNVYGVAHCFSSTYDVAKKLIDMGFYISFSGNLTFKNSHLPDVAKRLPIDRLLVETDSPFLSPAPHRGKTNEPGRARFVADLLARLHNLSINEVARITTTNAKAIFNFS